MKPYFDQPYSVCFSVGGFELGLLPGGTPVNSGPQPQSAFQGIRDAPRSAHPA